MASITYIKSRRQWRVRWHVTGPDKKVHKGSKLLPKGCTREDAENLAGRIEDQARQIKMGTLQLSIPLSTAVEAWLTYCRRHTDSTLSHYTRVIEKFTESLQGRISHLPQIKAIDIHRYITAMTERGCRNRTINSHLAPIKSFFRFCSDTYKQPNPAAEVKMLKDEPPKQRFLSTDEYQKIVDATKKPFQTWARFLANTGLRVAEFAGLRWQNLSNDLTSLTVNGKARKRRTIPLNSICQEILLGLKAESDNKPDSLIFMKKSKKINESYLLQRCYACAKKLGIQKFSPHTFRHYFATQLLLKGVPISKVSKLLGHASIRTTERIYIHILPADLQGITQCLT